MSFGTSRAITKRSLHQVGKVRNIKCEMILLQRNLRFDGLRILQEDHAVEHFLREFEV